MGLRSSSTRINVRLKGATIIGEQKLDVIVKAIKLMKYTLTITTNRKRFPVKYSVLVKKIQNTCMNIYENLMEANRTNVVTGKIQRNELQTKAITCCDKLSCYAEVAMEMKLVGSDTIAHWQKQINDIKYMTIGWRSKDKSR